MQNLVVWGGGGLGVEVAAYLVDIAARDDSIRFHGVLDPYKPRLADLERIAGRPIARFREIAELQGDPALAVVIGIGDPVARLRLSREAKRAGVPLARALHPTAYVAPTASVAAGVVLAPFAFVAPFAVVGESVVLNTYASIGHDAVVGEGSTLSPYSCLNGAANLGRAAFLGSFASLAPKSSVGDGSKVSAGSSFKGIAEPGSMIHGNPAKARVMMRVELPD